MSHTRVRPRSAVVVALATLLLTACTPVQPTTPTTLPTAVPTTAAPSPTPTETTAGAFPTRDSVGLPDGWVPAREVTGDIHLTTPNEVVEDLRVTNGGIYVEAPGVTLRRIEGRGAFVQNETGDRCYNGLVIEDSEFIRNGPASAEPPVIGPGGLTVRRTVIDSLPEGIRVGGRIYGCGPVTVEQTYILVTPPDVCGDWHGDGIQGYGGDALTVRWTTIVMDESSGCYGTAPFFYPADQGNTSVDIDGLLVAGGGFPFRNSMPGPVRNLFVVQDSWGYGPVEGDCSVAEVWDAYVATLDDAGQPVVVAPIPC